MVVIAPVPYWATGHTLSTAVSWPGLVPRSCNPQKNTTGIPRLSPLPCFFATQFYDENMLLQDVSLGFVRVPMGQVSGTHYRAVAPGRAGPGDSDA